MLRETPSKGSYKKLNSEPKYSSKSYTKPSNPVTPTRQLINPHAIPNNNNHHIPHSKSININTYNPKDTSATNQATPLITPSPQTNNQVADLLYNKNDSYEDVLAKNVKLRALVIQASTTIRDLNKKCQDIEQNCNIEKTTILNELEKISKNYQLYAESHKQRIQMQNDFEHLHQQYAQNNKVMEAYQTSIVGLLRDNMKTFVNVANVLDKTVNVSNPQEFLCEMKMALRDNLNKYQMIIDGVVFGTFYEEYVNFLEVINDVDIQEKEMGSIKKKRPMMRKKEYVDNVQNNNKGIDAGKGHSPIKTNNGNIRGGNHLKEYVTSQPYRFKQRVKSKPNKSCDATTSNKSRDEFCFE